jgi:hypothetical protein
MNLTSESSPTIKETPLINSDRVHEIFMDCLFNNDEDTTNHIRADGISLNIGFHPERIKLHEEEISVILNNLSEAFRDDCGGGASFFAGFKTKNNEIWTADPGRVEELFQLGIAIGRMICPIPQSIWHLLPNGIPYYILRAQKVENTNEHGLLKSAFVDI